MELSIVRFFNQLGFSEIDPITNFISWIPFLIILWFILAFLALFFDKNKGKWVLITILLTLALHFLISDGLLKHFLPMRVRPYLTYPDLISAIGKQFTDSSFPSGHMASTTAVLTVLVYFYRRIWPLALFFILLMAFARLHNGMHYPSDVLGGSVLGLFYGVMAIYIIKKYLKFDLTKS